MIKTYFGVCVGGPYNGQKHENMKQRFPVFERSSPGSKVILPKEAGEYVHTNDRWIWHPHRPPALIKGDHPWKF